MVRAILEGRKTQTRRVVKDTGLYAIDPSIHGVDTAARELKCLATRCPHGQPGDKLWVREKVGIGRASGNAYFPDELNGREPHALFDRWTHWIHMPRWASRITLEVTGIRVERLQEISEKDAKAEGVPAGELNIDTLGDLHRMQFADLWDAIAKPDTQWFANPWVWVVEFRKNKI